MDDRAATSPPPLGLALPHDSAEAHVTGTALYIDDLPEPPGLLHAALALSTEAHAGLTALDLAAARALLGPGGIAIDA